MEYVLPLRWGPAEDGRELTSYLRELSGWLDVTVVDGSAEPVFSRHRREWGALVRHVAVEPWPGGNGKVAGVVTGLRLARHEQVVIADDDVRWDRAGLVRAVGLLRACHLVRPQNVFEPMPWHARWDTARSLLNRALGADYPGTYAVRRSTFLAAGGYAGNVLFENLELSRTLRAAGRAECCVPDLFVVRRPPSVRHFLGQRVRQAYDDLAQPARLVTECALLPAVLALVGRAWSPGRGRRGSDRPLTGRRAKATLLGLLAVPVALAEIGRRKGGGRAVFPATAALWAPLWLLERAVCVWLALADRARGGTPYGGGRVRIAAHSVGYLRAHPAPPLTPIGTTGDASSA